MIRIVETPRSDLKVRDAAAAVNFSGIRRSTVSHPERVSNRSGSDSALPPVGRGV